ncbi:uncharacterized protein LOC124208962 [Daphnia pulex]|uniref:uncharacterized protein LOC124208962 n=1 Tax=Daphnia pulex TaxID=6669 RepID=UPI001EDE0DF2|nr:uncharacterized protein LOC124208962 [Daphnia pulex]
MLQSAILIKPHPFFTWALMGVFFQSAFSLSWITTSTKEKYGKILHHSGHMGIVYICRTKTYCHVCVCVNFTLKHDTENKLMLRIGDFELEILLHLPLLCDCEDKNVPYVICVCPFKASTWTCLWSLPFCYCSLFCDCT